MADNFKKKQQEMTELNSDGNETRGRYGEDYESQVPWKDYDESSMSKAEKIRKEQAQDRRHNQL